MPKLHAVVDGSNLATEGRSEPSLAQLDEAVATFASEHHFDHITVVVDASFEHRVTKREQKAAKQAIEEGRLVTPPAGVVGRGDTFILEVAEKAGAVVVSNDSFQEFHGRFDWLFEEGRLIGGKPVEHVGWVFVPRVPVRGKTSRDAVRQARDEVAGNRRSTATKQSAAKKAPADKATTKKTAKKSAAKAPAKKRATKQATKKSAAKKAPADKATTKKRSTKKTAASAPGGRADKSTAERPAGGRADKAAAEKRSAGKKSSGARSRGKGSAGNKATSDRSRGASTSETPAAPYNSAKSWRRFRSDHPVGSTVEATVDRYSSHGAYATTSGGQKAYLPSQLLADPPPKRARDVVAEGETRSFHVHRLDEATRGIDLGLVPVEAAGTL